MSSNNSSERGEQHEKGLSDFASVLPDDDDCGLERFVRNRYFHGKLMTARDMQLEQEYHADRLETLAQHATGGGAVCGLSTTLAQEGEGEPLEVTVGNGYALDSCGRPVLIDDTAHESISPDHESFPSDDADGVAVYVRLSECHTEKVPVSGSEDACREDCTYNRVVEDFEIRIDTDPPDPKSVHPVEFPDMADLETYDEETGPEASDPGLQTVARSYYQDGSADGFAHDDCDQEGDPRVFLGYYVRSGTEWTLSEEADIGTGETAPRHYVYTNDMLYAAIARHAADFENPHDVVTSVNGVEHDNGNVELASADDSIVTGRGTDRGTVNLEVAGAIRSGLEAIEEYVRDKTLKYTIEVFYEVAERYDFDNEHAREVNVRSRAIILAAREALAEAVFEDEFRFAAAALYIVSLESGIRREIEESREEGAPIASDESFEYYESVVRELGELLPDELAEEIRGENGRFEEFTVEFLERLRAGDFDDDLVQQFIATVGEFAEELRERDGGELDVTGLAVAQDQIAEAAGWLERAEEPATMVLPGGEQEVDARIIELAMDRRGGPAKPRPAVSLDGGLSPYTIGDERDVTGTASGDVDRVAVYARDQEAWEHVEVGGNDTIEVDDNEFLAENVVLSAGGGGGNELLGFAGTYRIGVIDDDDAPSDYGEIATDEFRTATTDSRSIRVVEPRASISLDRPVGDVFLQQPADVRGSASGDVDEVAIVAQDMERRWRIVELVSEETGLEQTTIPVEGDIFEFTDALLPAGEGEGNEILSDPGEHRIAAIDVADVDDTEIDPGTTIPPGVFQRATTDTNSITVVLSR